MVHTLSGRYPHQVEHRHRRYPHQVKDIAVLPLAGTWLLGESAVGRDFIQDLQGLWVNELGSLAVIWTRIHDKMEGVERIEYDKLVIVKGRR